MDRAVWRDGHADSGPGSAGGNLIDWSRASPGWFRPFRAGNDFSDYTQGVGRATPWVSAQKRFEAPKGRNLLGCVSRGWFRPFSCNRTKGRRSGRGKYLCLPIEPEKRISETFLKTDLQRLAHLLPDGGPANFCWPSGPETRGRLPQRVALTVRLKNARYSAGDRNFGPIGRPTSCRRSARAGKS